MKKKKQISISHGVLGFMVAAMLAAFMSTHDSYLLCWSTIITNDIIDPLTGGKLSSKQKIKISRIIIIILGLYILYWGLVYDGLDSIWSYLCLLYTSPSPRDLSTSRMPSSA